MGRNSGRPRLPAVPGPSAGSACPGPSPPLPPPRCLLSTLFAGPIEDVISPPCGAGLNPQLLCSARPRSQVQWGTRSACVLSHGQPCFWHPEAMVSEVGLQSQMSPAVEEGREGREGLVVGEQGRQRARGGGGEGKGKEGRKEVEVIIQHLAGSYSFQTLSSSWLEVHLNPSHCIMMEVPLSPF